MDTHQKKFARPSIRNSMAKDGRNNSTNVPVSHDFFWYLKNICGGQDKFVFETHDEAYKFGWSLREKYGDSIKVDITMNAVRVFAV